MASIWDKFDASIDTAGLEKDVEAAAQGNGNRKEVPHGTYEVAITKLELGESKKHDPMVKVWFKIVEGDFKGSLIFMNQVINQGFQIHIVNELLRDITGSPSSRRAWIEMFHGLRLDQVLDRRPPRGGRG